MSAHPDKETAVQALRIARDQTGIGSGLSLVKAYRKAYKELTDDPQGAREYLARIDAQIAKTTKVWLGRQLVRMQNSSSKVAKEIS